MRLDIELLQELAFACSLELCFVGPEDDSLLRATTPAN